MYTKVELYNCYYLLLLLCMLQTNDGSECAVWYSIQPPNELHCNPYASKQTNISCTVMYKYSNEFKPRENDLRIHWFQKNIHDNITNEKQISNHFIKFLNDTTASRITATLTLTQDVIENYEEELTEQHYWCQVNCSALNCVQTKSNILKIIPSQEEDINMPCEENISIKKMLCLAHSENKNYTTANLMKTSFRANTILSKIADSTCLCPVDPGMNQQESLFNIVLITLLAAVLLVAILVMCLLIICLVYAKKIYSNRIQGLSRSTNCDLQTHVYTHYDKGVEKPALDYLATDKLHIPQTQMTSSYPLYEEINECSVHTQSDRDTLYQQLSTNSQEYLSIYSLTRHDSKKETTDDEDEVKMLVQEEQMAQTSKRSPKKPLKLTLSNSSYVEMSSAGISHQQLDATVANDGNHEQFETTI